MYNMAMINKKNEVVEQNLDMQIQAILGSDKQSKAMPGVEEFMNQYKSQNEWEITKLLLIIMKVINRYKSILLILVL